MLAALISAGVLREGERLYASLEGGTHTEPKQFEAELVSGGAVRVVSDGGDGSLNGEEFSSPSAAITALYGRPDSGWMNWSVDRGGRRLLLKTIRDRWETSQAPTPE